MNCAAYTYYTPLIAKCTCTLLHHPLKLLPSALFLLCTNSSQLKWLHVKSLYHIAGCLHKVQLLQMPLTYCELVIFTDVLFATRHFFASV